MYENYLYHLYNVLKSMKTMFVPGVAPLPPAADAHALHKPTFPPDCGRLLWTALSILLYISTDLCCRLLGYTVQFEEIKL